METALTLDDVHRAIHALYHDSDTSGAEKASSWLGEFQKSVFAWKMSDELLQQNRDVVSSYFAAQTMRTKIRFSFHELPPESHHSLRDSLVRHICTVSDNNCAVLTQLCLALADLALQMTSWKMAVRDLIEHLSTNVKLIPALLEILVVLPEEFDNRWLRFGQKRRDELKNEFKLVGQTLFRLLVACMQEFGARDPQIHAKIFKCLGVWLGVGAMPTAEVARSDLLAGVFRSLGDRNTPSTVHEAASDCICEALVLIEEEEKGKELKEALLQGVRTLIEPYNYSVKSGDGDRCLNLCNVFTELVLSLLEEDVMKTTGTLWALEMVLVCLENGNREMAEKTFDVWNPLCESVGREGNTNTQLKETFKPYISRLIAALCRHCRLEPGFEGVLDDGDDFFEFRAQISELIKDIVFVVGASASDCFRQMFEGSSTWEVFEASLFVMGAVADADVLPGAIIAQVLGAVLDLPDDTHAAVRATGVRLVGELHGWIESHPRFIQPVLNFLLKCLHEHSLATTAAIALESICSACPDHMVNHLDCLLGVLRNVQFLNVSGKAAVGLFKGAVLVLDRMPFAVISRVVRQLCWILMREIYQTIHDSKDSPEDSLERLTAVFRNLDVRADLSDGETHPCADVVREIWPILSETFVKFQHDRRIIDKCCACVGFMIRCVGRQSSPLLEPVAKLIVRLYRVHFHSCYLYLGSVLVDVFPDFHVVLVEMLAALCGPTFVLLDGGNSVENHPDIVEDLFKLCLRCQTQIMVPFLQSSVFTAIVRCGLVACSIAHREANHSVLTFFKGLIQSHCSEVVGACLAEHGALLISNLIESCIFSQRFFMIGDLADVIFGLMEFDRRAVCSWVEEAVKRLFAQNSGGNNTVTYEQVIDFIRDVRKAKVCAHVTLALRKLSRLYC